MPVTGPEALIRVQGKEDHDIGEVNWEINKEKTPYVPVGKQVLDRFTAGPAVYTCTFTVQPKPNGTFGIDWDGWCKNDEEWPVVVVLGTRTERFTGVVIDSVGKAYTREDGRTAVDISGKFKDHTYA